MAKEFYVEEDLCTACGDCYKAMPKNFRDNGNDCAEVYSQELPDSELPALEKIMKSCPGKAILWKK